MITIYIIWPDKTREKWIKEGIEKYLSRLKHYVNPIIIQFKTPKNLKKKNKEGFKREEGTLIKSHLPEGFVITLDERGRVFNTMEFKGYIQGLIDRNIREIVFILGGDLGLSQEILELSDFILSLSPMTFPHEMARLILIEQLYRIFTIIKGEPYHH